ncbi:hypothetical protein [Chitinolyticbacter albus]|uniref:hypothetical protein n=1 Tax=Chitinolyticbacter albus TaxID=2961951 RepID=UPI00210BD074|nr:hypothetical protein [Chitinolyticbacter albus]
MKNYLNTVFLSRREGQIVLLGVVIYLTISLLHNYAPNISPVPPFYGMFSLCVLFALGLIYLQMGGFKRTNFESGLFNISILMLVVLTPVIIAIKSSLGL